MILDTEVDHRQNEEHASNKEDPSGDEEVLERNLDGVRAPGSGSAGRLEGFVYGTCEHELSNCCIVGDLQMPEK